MTEFRMVMYMQYAYCIIVLPTNLVLLVKQTQIATLELYRMHHAIHVLYVFMYTITYFLQMAAGGERKIKMFPCVRKGSKMSCLL